MNAQDDRQHHRGSRLSEVIIHSDFIAVTEASIPLQHLGSPIYAVSLAELSAGYIGLVSLSRKAGMIYLQVNPVWRVNLLDLHGFLIRFGQYLQFHSHDLILLDGNIMSAHARVRSRLQQQYRTSAVEKLADLRWP